MALITLNRPEVLDVISEDVVAGRVYTLLDEGMRLAMAVRDAHARNFLDVFFDDFCSRPLDMVRGNYKVAGKSLPAGWSGASSSGSMQIRRESTASTDTTWRSSG